MFSRRYSTFQLCQMCSIVSESFSEEEEETLNKAEFYESLCAKGSLSSSGHFCYIWRKISSLFTFAIAEQIFFLFHVYVEVACCTAFGFGDHNLMGPILLTSRTLLL